MSYRVTTLGKNYDLPARTLAVDEKIEEISKLDAQYKAGDITRRDAVNSMYSFVDFLLPGVLPPVEEVDTNDLLKACLDIITAYDAPARKARNEAQLLEVSELMKNQGVKDLIAATKAIKK